MQLNDSCEALRDLVKQLAFSRTSGLSDSDEVRDNSSKALKHLLQLKEDVRNSCIATEVLKDQTASCQGDLEDLNLQLQNLLYEKQFYENEIRSCMHFPSQFTDAQIGLIPEEEFKAQHPEEAATDDSYILMMKRLLVELADRKALLSRRDELKEQRDALQKKLSTARSSVDNVSNLLQTLSKSSEPLQQLLSPQLERVQLGKVAELLPLPMYVIYSQLAAAQEMADVQITVEIVGSAEQAQAFNSSFQPISTSIAEKPAVKRSKKNPSQSSVPISELVQPHPLSLKMTVKDSTKSPTVSVHITFQFLPHVRLVTASSPQDPSLPQNLFPGDTGDLEMVEVLQQQINGKGPITSLPGGGRPYRWAQQLAGMDFISSLPLTSYLPEDERAQVLQGFSQYRGQQRLQTLVELLLMRKASMMALNFLLTKPKGRALNAMAVPHNFVAPNQPKAVLTSWVEIKSEASLATALAKHEGSRGWGSPRADGEGRGWSGVDVDAMVIEGDSPSDVPDISGVVPSSRLFAAELRTQIQGTAAHVLACSVQIKIFLEYPLRPPAFRVLSAREESLDSKGQVTNSRNMTSACMNDLQWIERQVNSVVLQQVPEESVNETLQYQMVQLRLCMDDVAKRVSSDANSSDMLNKLSTRQLLSGRDRSGHVSLLD